MLSRYLLGLVLLTISSLSFQQELNYTLNKVSLKILGQSGKMRITTNRTNILNGTNVTTTEQVVVCFKSLKELNLNGSEVGKTGDVKHSFNNFAQLYFTVSNLTKGTFQNLSVISVNFTATKIVNDKTTLTGMVHIFNDTGVINMGNSETANVIPGNVKFSIMVNDWPFCTNETSCLGSTCCKSGQTNEIGAYLDLGIQIYGNTTAKVKNSNSNVFSLGNSEMKLSRSVILDSNNLTTLLPDGFPQYKNEENFDTLTVRFPRFFTSAFYDPIISFTPFIEPDNSSSYLFLILMIVLVILLIVIGIVGYTYYRKKQEANNSLSENLENKQI
jgi:hypothetical protein